ncbi:MAG TPA: pseudouridine synthase [Bacillota bacterium]|nr:pseudouridine synthase [Bacillota bacterium]
MFLARAGLASRRASERLIAAGRVRVNGEVVAEPGRRVQPLRDRVEVDGQAVAAGAAFHRYLLLNKPKGFLTTVHDPRQRPTVLDLVRDVEERVYPVGRLDRDSEGLLLLTNDGELVYRLTHPRFGVAKVYRARVEGAVGEEALERLRRGVDLADGPAKATRATQLREEHGSTWLELEVGEGRHHLVRRMLAAAGHPVLDLRRVRFGPLELGRLRRGCFRELLPGEISALRQAVGLGGKPSDKRGGFAHGGHSPGGRRHAGRLRRRGRQVVLRSRRAGHHPPHSRGGRARPRPPRDGDLPV